ncbi:hypothetical protein GCM10007092_13670 [Thermus composti]|uniref:Carboxypeptidase regulatory-like domain-containing protein n=1 Tax=Thermus composti TaxID=532059 RepID=A0ABV6PZA7_9DEIN|nr:hypothetical protein [Thermus composti]GGN00889.1 hypothetical protein GCM10007092_13670 [Thermus composti]
MRSLLALCLFLSLAWAQVRLLSPPSLAGIPGEYLTLSLEVEGQGPLVLRLFPPEGWQALSQERKAGLEGGRETVSFTLRVPFLPAGTQSKAEVVAYLGEKEAARAEVALSVLPLVQIALSAPATLEAQLGGPFEFPAYVQNRSNQRAKVLLEAEAAMFQVFLNPQGLELAPGETGVVRVLVNPQGEISAGYRFYLKLRATPEGKAEARKEAGVIVLFQETLGAKTQGKDPSLTLNLGLGLSLGANLERGQLTGQVGYLLAPSLTGALSDYVNLTATPSPLTESLSDPWPSPQTLALSLKGEGWEARAQGGGGGLSAGGTFRLGDARLGLEGSYRPQALSLRASAASLDSNLDLQGSLSTQLTPAGRQDNLNLRYRLPLESGLTLGLGTDLAGQTQGAYGLSLGLSQNLTWQTQELDLVQSYAGVPLAGLHVLGLTGGTRSLYPLGLRGSTSLQLGSLPALWQNQASLYYQPWSGTFLSLTLSYRQQGEDRGLGLNPGLATAFGEPGVYAGSLSLGYGLQRALSGQAPESQSYQGSLSLGTKDLSFSGFLRYLHQAQPYLEGNLLLRLVLPAGSLEGSYLVKQGNDQPLTLYGAAWNQLWPGSLQSRLFYEYRQEASPSQRLGLGLYRRNFLEPGLSLGASYTLILQAGEARHAFGLTLYYAQALSFATPREVVDLFGGRKGGEVMGQAFLDPNLNGRLDPGESPLADLKVCLGQVCEATDAQGRYRLVAASGAGTLRFLGLPATLALVGEAGVDVPLNARLEKNLPFAPATTLTVRVLDGEKGSGLAYAGVCAEGPVGRCTRADVNGNALLGDLFPGTYRLYPDPRYLPEGYRAEKEAQVRVELKPLEAPPLVVLPPKREVVVTYTAERLSLVATADPPTALAGAEVEVKALVQGQPERLWLDLPSGPVSLQPQEDNYYAIRIRLHLPPGLHALRVRASAQGQEAEAPLWLQVVPGALFEPQVVNSPKVHLTLRFRATQVTLQAEGQAFPLQSQDGYTWTGEVPLGPGQHTLLVFADGEALGPVRLDLPSESATQ